MSFNAKNINSYTTLFCNRENYLQFEEKRIYLYRENMFLILNKQNRLQYE